jgi:hypothetical protein
MALAEDILQVRALVGDTVGNPFYPLLDDTIYEGFLTQTNNDIMQAAKFAAVSISFMVAGWNTREQIGDLSFSNDFARNYQRVLQLVLTSPGLITIPQGMYPWSASNDTTNKLLEMELCGGCSC